jgi:hypothetical protein
MKLRNPQMMINKQENQFISIIGPTLWFFMQVQISKMLNQFMPFTFFPHTYLNMSIVLSLKYFCNHFSLNFALQIHTHYSYDGWDEKTPFAKGWLM